MRGNGENVETCQVAISERVVAAGQRRWHTRAARRPFLLLAGAVRDRGAQQWNAICRHGGNRLCCLPRPARSLFFRALVRAVGYRWRCPEPRRFVLAVWRDREQMCVYVCVCVVGHRQKKRFAVTASPCPCGADGARPWLAGWLA